MQHTIKPTKYKMKMWLLTWPIIFAILTVVFKFFLPYLLALNYVHRALILSGLMTFLMTFFIVPIVQIIFSFWLYPKV